MTINPSTLTILVAAFLSVVLMKYAKAQRFSGTVKNVKWRTKQRDQDQQILWKIQLLRTWKILSEVWYVLYNEEPLELVLTEKVIKKTENFATNCGSG